MSGWRGQRISGAALARALAETGIPNVPSDRLPLARALTRSQLAVAALSAAGLSVAAVAERLGCGVATVRWHIEEASARIPGRRLGARDKVIAWYCGASARVLGSEDA